MNQELINQIIDFISIKNCYTSTLAEEPRSIINAMLSLWDIYIVDNKNDKMISFYNNMCCCLQFNLTLEESLNKALIPFLIEKLSNDGFKPFDGVGGVTCYRRE